MTTSGQVGEAVLTIESLMWDKWDNGMCGCQHEAQHGGLCKCQHEAWDGAYRDAT